MPKSQTSRYLCSCIKSFQFLYARAENKPKPGSFSFNNNGLPNNAQVLDALAFYILANGWVPNSTSPCSSSSLTHSPPTGLSSTLEHLDASFYQVTRGLVSLSPSRPWATMGLLSPQRIPSPPIPSCSLVTTGFFTGIYLDGTSLSTLDIVFLLHHRPPLHRHKKVSRYPGRKWQRHSPVWYMKSHQLFPLRSLWERCRQAPC